MTTTSSSFTAMWWKPSSTVFFVTVADKNREDHHREDAYENTVLNGTVFAKSGRKSLPLNTTQSTILLNNYQDNQNMIINYHNVKALEWTP